MLKKQYLLFIPAIAIWLSIFALSTFLSFPMQVEGISFTDKIQHSFAYFVLVLSFLIAFKKSDRLSGKKATRVVALTMLYGFSLELVQYLFFPNRYFEWLDALANMLGALAGYGLFMGVSRVR